MKKQVITFVLLLMSISIFAQSNEKQSSSSNSSSSYHKKTSVTTTTTETNSNSWYLGASAGYLFKNNSLHNNPMWYLNNGQFYELNVGTRGKLFGWSAALGYMTIKRDVSQFDHIIPDTQMIFDSINGDPIQRIPSDLSTIHATFIPDSNSIIKHKPYKGFYFLTGPNLWFGNGKLKFNLALEAGIGYTQVGYYFVNGYSERPVDFDSKFTGAGAAGTPVTYTGSMYEPIYQQFGMSQKYHDKLAASSMTDPFDEKQDYEVHFMGRLTGNVEYFILPRLSIHGGLNFWYISAPKMIGQQAVSGGVGLSNSNGSSVYQGEFSYTKPYAEKDLTYLSANIGLKYWFGGNSSSTKTVVTEESSSNSESSLEKVEEEKQPKALAINVIDKLTKTPMGDVAVTLTNLSTGKDTTVMTQANGVVKLEDIEPGNYEINGEILNIPTSSDNVDVIDFASAAPTIYSTLYYDDPRFILKGVTVNLDNGQVVDNVQVNLAKDHQDMAQTYSNDEGNFKFLLDSNSDYEVQGLKNGLFSNTAKASTKGLTRSQTLYVKLQLGMSTVEVGRTFQIDNIHYDFDKANIRPDAARELDKVVDFLTTNPDVRIELSSHTDSRGSDAYNLKLSQRRAESAVNYLVDHGISRSRLVAKGYGETRLLNKCKNGIPCTDAEHQANRRTEITIIE